MKDNSLAENFTELRDILKKYLDARIKLWKILLLEKLTKAGTYILTILVFVVVLASLLLLLLFAFSFWYGNVYGNIYYGFLISAGFYVLVGVLLFLLRRPIFSNNIIRNLGKIFFSEDKEE